MKIQWLISLWACLVLMKNETNQTHFELVKDANEESDNRVPDLILIEPLERKQYKAALRTIAPCGGVPKGKSHLMTVAGQNTLIQWRVMEHTEEGNCTIRLSSGVEAGGNFQVLIPHDQTADAKGKFPCGRESNIAESKFVTLPEGLSCDQCIAQLEWETHNGTFYYCGEITVMDEQLKQCAGMCKNGGSCVNGACLCPAGFSGTLCEKAAKAVVVHETHNWLYGLAALLLVLICVIFLYLCLRKNREEFQEIQEEMVPSNINSKIEEPKPNIEYAKRSRGDIFICSNSHGVKWIKSGDKDEVLSCSTCGKKFHSNRGM